jgi:hypothetical protein
MVEMTVFKERRIVGLVALAAALGLVVGSLGTYAALQWTARIPTTAQLKLLGVGVYKDISFTIPVTQIDWGILEPGESKNFSAYIKNESNVPITLSMHTEDWNPTNASSLIGFSWDYQGSQISVDGSIPVTFILNVNQATAGFRGFSFTIVIVGSG